MLTKDSILQVKDTPYINVEIPEWGGNAFVKTLTGAERLRLEADISQDAKTNGPALTRVVCATLCDEQGRLLFDYPKDIDALNTKSVKVLHRLFDVALKVNALSSKDVDELEKNQVTTRSDFFAFGQPQHWA